MPPQTPLQKRAVDAIMAKVESFLEYRFRQVRRVNPKVESVWDDLAWQQMTKLRASLSGDKAFGPVRFHVAELLLSDDYRRVRELFSHKSQASLQGEMVEEKDSGAQRTAGQMELHDMRSLCKAIEPQVENVAVLLQTFVWWDLEDAVDLARFDRKVGMLQSLEKLSLTEEMAKYYKEITQSEHKMTKDEAILYECRMLKRTVDSFRLRRAEEHGYQALIAREQTQADNEDVLIEALGSQMGFMRGLKAGQQLDDNMRQQVGRAMGVEPAAVTPEKVIPWLEATTTANKKRLKNALIGGGTGDPYNYKLRMLEQLEQRLKEAVGDRELVEASAAQPSAGA